MKLKTINPHLCGEKAHKQFFPHIAMPAKYPYPYNFSNIKISN